MSRHRNVRKLNYEEEYDGYYDEYGRSVEDEYGVSPATAAEFMYDRNQRANMSAYFAGQDIQEEDPKQSGEDEDADDSLTSMRARHNSMDYSLPKLSLEEDLRLKSCLEELRNVLGENTSEPNLVQAVLQNNFDFEKALNSILTSISAGGEAPKPQRERRERRRDKGSSKPEPEVQRPGVSESGVGDINSDQEGIARGIARMCFSSSRVVTLGFDQQQNAHGSQNGVGAAQTDDERVKTDLEDGAQTEQGDKSDLNGSDSTQSKLQPPDVQPTRKISAKVKNSAALAAEIEEEYAKARSDSKPQLSLVVVGHVDAGKSTLMGHLLYKLGNVSSKTMHKFEQEARKLGKQSFIYAWVLDETGEERSRGITMDIGQSSFETPNRTVRLLDAPGHRDFIPAMITGTAQADVALLVVDATTGEFETGFEAGGQTREHALLVRSLGVSQLGVAINKMDNVGWSQVRFQEIQTKLGQFLKQAGFRDADITYVPCSGLSGENVSEPAKEDSLKNWYSGPTLLQVIDSLKPPERSVSKPFRSPVNDVFKAASGGGFCVSGRIETGRINPGDKILVMPQGEVAQVKAVSMDDLPVTSGYAGDQVLVTLTGVDMSIVTNGSMLCDPAAPIPVTQRIQARVIVFNFEVPITKGFPVIFHCQALVEPAIIKKLISQLHKSTGEVVKKKPRCLLKNSQAEVEIEISRPICIEVYRTCKELGRFMLRSGGSTIAAGLVTEILQ